MKTGRFFIIAAAIACYAGIHLYTLDLWPLPWFDETVFASVAHTLAHEGRMSAKIAEHHFGSDLFLLHGPVYHSVCALFIQLFGISPFVFRLTALLAGIWCVWLIYRLLRQLQIRQEVAGACALLLALDPLFNQSMHEGRPETLGAALALAGAVLMYRPKKPVILVGLLWAAAFLCTPRTVVWILPLSGAACVYLLRGKHYRRMGMLGMAILVPLLLWIYLVHGGMQAYVNYYLLANAGAHSVDSGYVMTGMFYIPRHVYLLIATALLFFIIGLWQRQITFARWCAFGTLLLFYVIFRDLGPYSALVIPAWYLLIFAGPMPGTAMLWANDNALLPPIRSGDLLPIALLLFNCGFFFVKNFSAMTEAERRRPAAALNFVKTHLPPGAKVAGDPMYYYACMQAGAEYRLADKFSTPERREAFLRTDYNYEYLLLSRQESLGNKESIALFFAKAELEPIGAISFPVSKAPLLPLLSQHEQYGYEAVIFERE